MQRLHVIVIGMGKQHSPVTPETCPVCGEDVPPRALACPECGADHNSGWREEVTRYDGIDLPDGFDYEEFAQRELRPGGKAGRVSMIWWITAVVLLGLTILYLVL